MGVVTGVTIIFFDSGVRMRFGYRLDGIIVTGCAHLARRNAFFENNLAGFVGDGVADFALPSGKRGVSVGRQQALVIGRVSSMAI